MSIWQRMFAPERGNKVKRWIRFHQAMNRKRWFELDSEKNGPITLFDFSTVEDAIDAALVSRSNNKQVGWRITDDSMIGGYSHATMKLVRTKEDYKRLMNGQEPIPFLDQLKEAAEQQEPVAKHHPHGDAAEPRSGYFD